MKFFTLTPAEQIAAVMRRVYEQGLTTASGGNISILAENGDIWITPKGYDKGSVTREDIVCVHPDGSFEGKHVPSTEIAFHRATYRARPDFRAVVHAHPVYCIAFSLTRTMPRFDLLPDTLRLCRNMRISKYAMMGSEALGENLFAEFSKGADIVFLENHGVCVGGENLLAAFQRFECIEYAAKLDLFTRKTGSAVALTTEQYALTLDRQDVSFPALEHSQQDKAERDLRVSMTEKLRRGCVHGLLTGAVGVCSARLDGDTFLITPEGMDNAWLEENDLVLVRAGSAEATKQPAGEAGFHAEIYRQHPGINAIFSAAPLHVTAFGASKQQFLTSTVPESYYMLRTVPRRAFEEPYTNPSSAAAQFSEKTPVVLFNNSRVVATGASLFTAFDRLEVAEATAASLITASEAGSVIFLSDAELQAMKTAFHLE